eukprot:scaffold5374_cov100-Skeletonema_dohrnii-CCMP3373.AAC.2
MGRGRAHMRSKSLWICCHDGGLQLLHARETVTRMIHTLFEKDREGLAVGSMYCTQFKYQHLQSKESLVIEQFGASAYLQDRA